MWTVKRSLREKQDGLRGVVDLTGLDWRMLLKSYVVWARVIQLSMFYPLVGQLMWIFYPIDNVVVYYQSDLSVPGAEVTTLPSSSLPHCLVKPKRSLPHTCFFRFRPSPNSSFHLRRSANVPRDSDAEGVISLRAFAKLWGRRIRLCMVEAAGSSDVCVAPPSTLLLICDMPLDGEFLLLSTTHGTETFSLTASNAADTHKSKTSGP
jgi:hypothetical protein